jgi:8-oxo-dGTP diphosphatase
MNTIGVGIGVIIQKGDFILMGKRKNSHGAGTWSIPGGHLEFGESFEACARREVLEETGLHIGKVRQGPTTNNIFSQENKQSVSIFMVAEYITGVPELLEPEKCEGWEWFTWDALPQPLFLPMQNLIDQFLAQQIEGQK